jgi:hypothetical protein
LFVGGQRHSLGGFIVGRRERGMAIRRQGGRIDRSRPTDSSSTMFLDAGGNQLSVEKAERANLARPADKLTAVGSVHHRQPLGAGGVEGAQRRLQHLVRAQRALALGFRQGIVLSFRQRPHEVRDARTLHPT